VKREKEMRFDEMRLQWIYKETDGNLTIYGYGDTKEEAKENFKKNAEEMWEW